MHSLQEILAEIYYAAFALRSATQASVLGNLDITHLLSGTYVPVMSGNHSLPLQILNAWVQIPFAASFARVHASSNMTYSREAAGLTHAYCSASVQAAAAPGDAGWQIAQSVCCYHPSMTGI